MGSFVFVVDLDLNSPIPLCSQVGQASIFVVQTRRLPLFFLKKTPAPQGEPPFHLTMTESNYLSQRAHWAGGEPIASRLMARTLAYPDLVSLAAGFVDQQSLPVEPTAQALVTLWSDPSLSRAALQYGTTIGFAPLREAIVNRLLSADGQSAAEAKLSADQVVITAGSNQLLHLLGETLLDPGDIVLCGAPSYYVFLGTLANLGARAIGVAVDQEGVIPEAVEEQLARLDRAGELGRVKFIYLTTYYDNPTGITLPAARRAALVEMAQRWSRRGKIYLVEDMAYRELRYHGDDTPSLRAFDAAGDTVIVAGSFSKSYSPGVRVGWGILPPKLLAPLLSIKGNVDFGSPNFNQILMTAVVNLGLFDQHVERLRNEYRTKIDALLQAADQRLAPLGAEWVRPTGGLYLWVRLPEGIDAGLSGPLFDRAIKEGVLYVPGDYCYPPEGEPIAGNRLRLSFGIPSCASIRQGIEALARALREVL
jgi:2-aminoadipate transaminase